MEETCQVSDFDCRANNHYAGFVTGTVKIFRQLLGLEEVKWGNDFIATNDLDKEDNHCRVNGKKNKI